MRLALILLTALPIWAQTTAGPVTQIVTGGTIKVTGGTQIAQSGTPIVFGGTTVVGGGGALATWTHIQDSWGPSVTSGTTVSMTLAQAPAAGNLVVCNAILWPRQAPTLVQDNAATPNTYTVTPHSPATAYPQQGVAMAYLVAPAGAGATITATVGTAISAASWVGCAEFHKSPGIPAFDTDAAGTGGGAGVAVINTPSVTVAAAGELLVTGIFTSTQCGITYNAPWVRWIATPPQGNICGGYVLSSSAGSNAINIGQASGASWNSMLAAFK